MIVPMKRLALFCAANEATSTLEALRALKCVHVDLSGAGGAAFNAARERLSETERAVFTALKAAKESRGAADGEPYRAPEEILAAETRRVALVEEADKLRRAIAFYAPYGDFDPALARALLERGVDLAAVAEIPDPLPEERLSAMRARLAEMEGELAAIRARLAATGREAARFTARFPALAEAVEFEAAREALKSVDALAYIVGWVPVNQIPAVRAAARRHGWGIAFRDPLADEDPPVLIRPPKLFRPVRALFEGLGIAPAYRESDVSVPFLCYFSVFFAMLVGDGAYGALFLAATLWGWRKTKPKEVGVHRPAVLRSWLTLMTVFSAATVLWGVLSNTWFGASIPLLDGAGAPAWAAALCTAFNAVFNGASVQWLADPSYRNMMLLCFTIGASHLMLARIWNGVCRINDSTCLAEFGWAGVLLFMYLVTNAIVGIFPSIPAWGVWTGGVSFALVLLFTVKPRELRARGAELGMLPLNAMGALGDIISYVRLFAVGLASVKVAENFNAMATGLVGADKPWWLNCVMGLGMVVVLVLGHGLNLVMAGLSILVHAVRLNTLEFSNHKGVSWSGAAYRPFKKLS